MSEKVIPTFVIIGNAGSGKSTLCNTLTESNKYVESSGVFAETKETVGFPGTFTNQETFVIDTPGLQDGSGLDTPHLVQMAQYIKSKKEAQALIIVLNFFHYRLDESIKKLFQLVANMYPQTKWYHNLAVVWSHYFSNLPENLKDTSAKKSQFKEWFKQNVENDIFEEEAKNIPQYFIDSCEARNPGNESSENLKHLVAWCGQLKPLLQEYGEIKVPHAQIKEKIEEKQTKVISTSQKLNIKITVTAEFKRDKCIPYIGDVFYTEWEEIEGTRKESKEVLPVVPQGPEKKEQKTSEIMTPQQKRVTNRYNYKNTMFGRRHYVEEGYYYQTKRTIIEERTAQPMNDGTVKYGEWKIISSNDQEIRGRSFYENNC